MKSLFPFMIISVFLIVSCKYKQHENTDSKNFKLFKDVVFERLSRQEYKLTTDQLCYVKPMLDTLESWNKIIHKNKNNYKIINTYLAYCDLGLSLVEVKDRKFLFTTQLDRDLMTYSNENFQKEIVPKVEEITHFTDFTEFKNMIFYFKESKIYDSLTKSEIVEIFRQCFEYSLPWYNSNKIDKYRPLGTEKDLENWKDIYLGNLKNQVELPFEKDKIYLPYFKYGLIILNVNDDLEVKLLKKIYPNDTKFINSYDVGIPSCNELKL